MEGGEQRRRKTATKQANRKVFFTVCQEAGLTSLASKFGLTPEQFGENLRDNYQRHETELHSVEPEEVAQDYVQPSGYLCTYYTCVALVYILTILLWHPCTYVLYTWLCTYCASVTLVYMLGPIVNLAYFKAG